MHTLGYNAGRVNRDRCTPQAKFSQGIGYHPLGRLMTWVLIPDQRGSEAVAGAVVAGPACLSASRSRATA